VRIKKCEVHASEVLKRVRIKKCEVHASGV
jgi:hypothetical protein